MSELTENELLSLIQEKQDKLQKLKKTTKTEGKSKTKTPFQTKLTL